MINRKHKCIFIHINKCGGTTLDYFFNRRHCGHKSALGYRRKYSAVFAEYFKFSFVRNPWDKMVSFYHYHTRRNWDLHWDWSKEHAPCFSDFLRVTQHYNKTKHKRIFKHPDTGHMRMSNQLAWLVDGNGSMLVDFVGRYEKYQEDFNIICDKIGIPRKQLPHKNKSKHKHYTEYYDDETRQIVAEQYAKDIEYFGYKFGD